MNALILKRIVIPDKDQDPNNRYEFEIKNVLSNDAIIPPPPPRMIRNLHSI